MDSGDQLSDDRKRGSSAMQAEDVMFGSMRTTSVQVDAIPTEASRRNLGSFLVSHYTPEYVDHDK